MGRKGVSKVLWCWVMSLYLNDHWWQTHKASFEEACLWNARAATLSPVIIGWLADPSMIIYSAASSTLQGVQNLSLSLSPAFTLSKNTHTHLHYHELAQTLIGTRKECTHNDTQTHRNTHSHHILLYFPPNPSLLVYLQCAKQELIEPASRGLPIKSWIEHL